MPYFNNSLSYKRAARILTVACGLLFSIFSIVYLFVLQKDVVGALHYSLSQGKTHYSPLVGAIIITVVLLVFRWGINGLMGLKGPVRTLSYFPSCLLLLINYSFTFFNTTAERAGRYSFSHSFLSFL